MPDEFAPDFRDVRGQAEVNRALEIAAAGGHNIIMVGPPGSGKSMLAKRLPSILPDMTFEESLETTQQNIALQTAVPTSAMLHNQTLSLHCCMKLKKLQVTSQRMQ